jgi:hypothetical protein
VEIADFVDELSRTVDKDPWEPNDSGFQLDSRTFIVKVRKSEESIIGIVVEDRDGGEIMKASQKTGPTAVDDAVTLKLSFLYQALERKPVNSVAALDDVIRELRTGRAARGG